jgi:hypothetical protein
MVNAHRYLATLHRDNGGTARKPHFIGRKRQKSFETVREREQPRQTALTSSSTSRKFPSAKSG